MDNVNIIRPGFIAPLFELFDSEGKKINLASFFGEKIVVLVFFSSLKENQDFLKLFQEKLSVSIKRKEIRLKGGVVLGISGVRKRELRKEKRKLNLEFPLLCDKDFSVISQYGVKDTSSEKGLCYPAIFIIDRNGLIRYRKVWVEKNFKPDLDEILFTLDELI